MSSPVLWGPNNISSNLESGMQFSGQAGPSIQTGAVNPSLVATNGIIGSIYLNSATAIIYSKNDNGVTTNWRPVLTSTNSFAPTIQLFTSGSGTYTTPSNVSYIHVRMLGAGGGGGGNGTAGASTGGNGSASSFGVLTASGGTGSAFSTATAATVSGGPGGSATGGNLLNMTGGQGQGSGFVSGGGPTGFLTGGAGGSSVLGPGGVSGGNLAGTSAAVNTGGGGAGAGNTNACYGAAGAGAGGYVEHILNGPALSYSYSVGAGGTAGAAGTSGTTGGAGGSGYIEITEYYVAPSQQITTVNDDVGAIVTSATVTAPGGTLLADGSAVLRSTYSALFTKIGTTWGAGDGSTTFNLPDLRGIFLRGAGTNGLLTTGNTGTLGQYQGDQMQGHVHQEVVNGGGGATNMPQNVAAGSPTIISVTTGSPVSDGVNGTPRTGTETRPSNAGVLYFIRYSPSTGLGTAAAGGGGISRVVLSVAIATTAAAAASTDYVYFVSGTTTITLPTAVSNTNQYRIKNTGTNTVTIATTSAQTIDGSSTAPLPVANTALILISDGSNWRIT